MFLDISPVEVESSYGSTADGYLARNLPDQIIDIFFLLVRLMRTLVAHDEHLFFYAITNYGRIKFEAIFQPG